MLGAALETTRADINAAAQAQEAGEERLISLSRTGVRLNARHLAELRTAIEELIETAREHPDDDGVWTTVLWTAVDREDRAARQGDATETRLRKRSSDGLPQDPRDHLPGERIRQRRRERRGRSGGGRDRRPGA